MSNSTSTCSREEIVTLVATNVPKGHKVHTEFGISESLSWPTIREKRTDRIYSVLMASEVGLEWRDKKGIKISESDRWAGRSFVVTSKEIN